MKVLVFSDTHLTDKFEDKKYLFLEKLIREVDQVIINGDFWDGHLVSIGEFLSSKWSGLFPLLKSKNTIYIYGNHDREEFSDGRVKLFSMLHVTRYTLHDSGQTFIIEHGNRLAPSFDERLVLPEWFFRILTIIYTVVENVLTRFFRSPLRFWGVWLNNKLKKTVENGNYYIFGHTHLAEFDPKHKFINTGFIQHGLAQYLIIEDGKPIPKQEWYG